MDVPRALKAYEPQWRRTLEEAEKLRQEQDEVERRMEALIGRFQAEVKVATEAAVAEGVIASPSAASRAWTKAGSLFKLPPRYFFDHGGLDFGHDYTVDNPNGVESPFEGIRFPGK